MVKANEHPERTALVTIGGEISRGHCTRILSHALRLRLGLDRRNGLATLISASEQKENDGPITDSGYFAAALVGRLRVDRRDEIADAIVLLLRGGPLECDPVLRLNEVETRIAIRNSRTAEFRSRGRHELADLVESGLSMDIKSALIERLHADGHHELADAISAAAHAFEFPERREGARPTQPRVVARKDEPSTDVAALWALGDELGRAHPADVLAYALVTRLRTETREVLAGSIMMLWARYIVGPIVDPGPLASFLVAQLRTEGRGALADTIASLLSGVGIDRDPGEIMTRWLDELGGPIVDPGPLAAALITALRKEKHEELADAVAALLSADR